MLVFFFVLMELILDRKWQMKLFGHVKDMSNDNELFKMISNVHVIHKTLLFYTTIKKISMLAIQLYAAF